MGSLSIEEAVFVASARIKDDGERNLKLDVFGPIVQVISSITLMFVPIDQ